MIKKILPYLCILLSLVILVFFVLDQFVADLNFIGGTAFRILLIVFGVATIASSVFLVLYNRKA